MKKEILDRLREGAAQFGVELQEKHLQRFSLYGDFLIEYNEKVNLTALTDEEEVMEKHFIDSLSILQIANLRPSMSVIDIGTGAGFPGVPLLIMEPNLQLTLLDSLQKRLAFLQELLNKLELTATLVHQRAEDGAHNALYRERYDLAVARAVAPLPVLLEYCLPYVRSGGRFLAMKGPSLTEELTDSQNALQILGGKAERDCCFFLPFSEQERRLLLVKKIRQTPIKYPRGAGTVKNKPL